VPGGISRNVGPAAAVHSGRRHCKRTFAVHSICTESTTHAVVPACKAQRAMPMAGGARDCWLLIDAVCATAIAVLTTICEGVTMAGDKPVFAASM
jgi:hypothetical protein